jgi:hypothetical protein
MPGDATDQPLRRCGRCQEAKPIEEFAWRRRARGQRDNYCSRCRAAYKQEHYAANRSRYIAQALARKRALAPHRAACLVEFFATNPCVDCGESDSLVLEFDHSDGDKIFCISKGLRDHSWQAVLDEIAKCDVVCANCHRRQPHAEGGSHARR